MPTRLAVFCDRLVEAGWLAAVALVPSFFNIYSNRVFEPDKLTLLRAIALIMVVAWLIGALDRFPGWRPFLEGLRDALVANPLVMPVLLFAGVYLLATVLSVSPGISFWGSYQRLQGTLSMASYLVVFFLICYGLRARVQVERLITVMVLTSVPMSLYAVIQHQRLDPLPWGGDVTVRVTSSMGNPIFLAAYLIMVVPFTLYLLLRTGRPLWQAWRSGGLRLALWSSLLLPLFYGAILLLQLVTILFTKSRGPWLGFGAGLALFLLLNLWRQGQRRLFLGVVGLTMAAAGFVLVLNLPGSPLAPLKEANTYLERLGSMLETSSGTGRVRMLIWFGDQFGKGALGLITADPYRTLVGWGPESMYVAYSRFYPPDLAHYEARNAVPDRSHNDLLDFLVTTGVLGLAAHLVVVGVFVAYVLKGPYNSAEPDLRLFAIAAIAAVGAHLVEAFFGIAIAATRTLYWAILGMAMAVLRMPATAWAVPASERSSPKGARRPLAHNLNGPQTPSSASAPAEVLLPSPRLMPLRREFPHFLSLVAALVMATLVLVRSPGGEPNFWLAFVVGLAVMFGAQGLLLAMRNHHTELRLPWTVVAPSLPQPRSAVKGRGAGEAFRRAPAPAAERDPFLLRWSNPWLYPFLGYLGLSALGLYLILARAPLLGMELEAIVLLGLAWLVVGFFVTAAWIERPLPTREFWRAGRVLFYGPLVAVAVVLLVWPIWGVVIADMYFKRGQSYDGAGQYLNSIPAYLKALEWDRSQDFYFLFLGRAFMELARSAREGPGGSTLADVSDLYELQRGKIANLSREGYIQASLVALEKARQLNPLNTDNVANLGRLYRFWAEVTPEAKRKGELFATSATYYQQATRLSPNTAHLYDEWGLVYLLQGRLQEALDKYQQALRLDDRFFVTYAYLGDAFSALNRLDEAEIAYFRALALDPSVTNVRNALGAVLIREGKLTKALQQFQVVAQQTPKDAVAHYNVAVVYQQMGRYQEALVEAEKALALAAEAEKPQMEALVSQLRRAGA